MLLPVSDASATWRDLASTLKRRDPDRYLTALFAPADRRGALIALYAFNQEIARVREAVSEPLLGRMRLQWWREAIDAIYAGRPIRHEVAVPLADAVARFGLDRRLFERMIDAREADLEYEPPPDLAALVRYAEESSGTLVALVLQALGASSNATTATARGVGVAYGLTGLIRAVPFHARGRRIYLPAECLDRHGVEPRDLFELRRPAGLAAVCAEVADAARFALAQARASRPPPPRPALAALLPATVAEIHLGRLARAGHDPFDPLVEVIGVACRGALIP